MRQRLCLSCRNWFESTEYECPKCGRPVSPSNRALRTARLNNHLFAAAEQAEKERRWSI